MAEANKVRSFEWTVSEAKSIKSVQDATPYVTAAGEGYKSYLREGESRQVAAALATHVAIATGYIGGSSPLKTQAEYAADLFGVTSSSEVTRWKTLGHALVVLGFKPDTMDFRRLAQACTRGELREQIMAADKGNAETRASIMTQVAKYRDENNHPVKKDRKAGGTTDQTDKDKGSKPESVSDLVKTDPMVAAHGLIEALDRLERDGELSLDQWGEIESKVRVILDRGNTIRSAALKTAVKSTPRPASKGRKVQPRTSKQVARKAS